MQLEQILEQAFLDAAMILHEVELRLERKTEVVWDHEVLRTYLSRKLAPFLSQATAG